MHRTGSSGNGLDRGWVSCHGQRKHRRMRWLRAAGRMPAEVVERLERRVMLAVTTAEYEAIRNSYPQFGLPVDRTGINIIEIAPEQLGVSSLKNAITAAAATTLPDLVVLRTSATQNTITYAGASDTLAINIPASKGAISIVGYGSRPLTLDAANRCGVVSIGSSSGSTTTVGLGGMTLLRGNAVFGGGVYQYNGTATLTNVTISSNTAGEGGGMYLYNGTSTLTNVTISGNTATYHGGGVFREYGTSTLTNVTISGNTARYGGGMNQNSGTSTLTNVMISGNTATSGGGAFLSHGTSTLTNVTISGNTAGEGWGGGGVHQEYGTLTLRNTIVARNAGGTSGDIWQYGTLTTLGGANNLIGDGSGQQGLADGVNGNRVGTAASPVDPRLAEGSILGIGLAPLPGSPAIDAGEDGLLPEGLSTDVYGAARVQGAHVNIGAVETVLPDKPGVTYVVTGLADTVAADGVLTLREALAAANTNQAAGDAAAGSYAAEDRIEFAAGLSGTILTNGQAYPITGSLSLVGAGASQLTLDARGSSGVLDIRGLYAVAISGLTLTGGVDLRRWRRHLCDRGVPDAGSSDDQREHGDAWGRDVPEA